MEIAALVISIVMPLLVLGLGWWKSSKTDKKTAKMKADQDQKNEEFNNNLLKVKEEANKKIEHLTDVINEKGDRLTEAVEALVNNGVKSADQVVANNISIVKNYIGSPEEEKLISSVGKVKQKIPVAESRNRVNQNKTTKKKNKRKPKQPKKFGKMK